MDEIDPRHSFITGQRLSEQMRREMANQARALNLFCVALVIAIAAGLVVYAAYNGLSRAEAAYQIGRV